MASFRETMRRALCSYPLLYTNPADVTVSKWDDTTMFGLVKREFTDHTLAQYLREQGAIDNYHMVGNSTTWKKQNGVAVVVAVYSEGGSFPVTYWAHPEFTRIKRIRSHTGRAQFLAQCTQEGEYAKVIGTIPNQPHIPSPYAYSPDWEVYEYHGRNVIVRETSHRCYDVFVVPTEVTITPVVQA